jgi:hypothetical protein
MDLIITNKKQILKEENLKHIRPNIYLFFLVLISFFSFLNNLTFSQEENITKKKPFFSLIKEENLKNIREEIRKLNQGKIFLKEKFPYKDIKCIFHCHSNLSHDSPGTIEDILKGAKENNVKAIFMSEHPSEKINIFTDGLKGNIEGVIFFAGGETKGFLVYPKAGFDQPEEKDLQKYVDEVIKNCGIIFMCHPDEERDWNLKNLTGMEIYNIHADLRDEEGLTNILMKKIIKGITQDFKELEIMEKYKQELYFLIFDEPEKFLKIFDKQCQKGKFVGIAGNDTHYNVGIVIKKIDDEKVEITDVLGENKYIVLPIQSLVEPIQTKARNSKISDKIFEIRLDPYNVSFKYVSTHIFVKEINEENILDSVRKGNCYVSFDWILPPEGFLFYLEDGEKKYPMGTEIKFKKGMKLKIFAPSNNSIIKLIKDGEKLKEEKNFSLEYQLKEKGIYRVEIHLPFLKKEIPWIYSNPIYVR